MSLILGLGVFGEIDEQQVPSSAFPRAPARPPVQVIEGLLQLREQENSLFMAIPPSFQKALKFIPLIRDLAVEVLSFCDFEYESEAQFVQMELLREHIKEAERALPLKKKK